MYQLCQQRIISQMAAVGARSPSSHARRLLSTAASTTPSTPSWEDHFQRRDLLNAWSNGFDPLVTAGPQEDYNNLLALDKSTRYVVQLLYDLYHNVSHHTLDRATTQRCNVALSKLSEIAMPNYQSALSGSISMRAYEILQGMELFYGKSMDERMVLPHPTGETYLMVLRMFAKDPLGNPQLAQAVVERMQQRYDELPGQLEMQPNVVHWNQVLSAWAVTALPDVQAEKAFHAATLLQRLKSMEILDMSSYSHVLRACAKSDVSPKSKQLGAGVAIKVYKEARKRTGLEPTTYLFTFFLQACSYISDPAKRDQEARTAYFDCANAGCVNSHVIAAFQGAASPQMFRDTFDGGSQRRLDDDPSASALLRRLPKSAIRNANLTKESGW
jgi:hypothetical protein